LGRGENFNFRNTQFLFWAGEKILTSEIPNFSIWQGGGERGSDMPLSCVCFQLTQGWTRTRTTMATWEVLSHGGLGFLPVCLTNQAMVFQDWHLRQARFV